MGCSQENAGSPAVSAVPEELAGVYRLAESDLARVGEIIIDRLRDTDSTVDEILRYSFRLGGKRLRPLLLILAAMACGEVREEHHLSAAALEMIHTGTLIHDDILDGAQSRRHLETINLRWDSKFAVLAGDLLLTKAITLITDCGAPEIYPIIADACRATCEGELLQVASSGRLDLTREEYRRIIEGKTAALLETSCQLGTMFTNQPSEVTRLFTRFGRSLGLAFQIFDDILDLTGTDSETGKTLGTDLLNKKLTLPVIRSLETASAEEKNAILSLFQAPGFGPREAEQIRAILLENGSIDYARQKALDLVGESIQLLEPLIPSSTPKQRAALCALQDVARFIANRNK